MSLQIHGILSTFHGILSTFLVILSEAKDLASMTTVKKILRCAQNDKGRCAQNDRGPYV
jgi:hypothetical protein